MYYCEDVHVRRNSYIFTFETYISRLHLTVALRVQRVRSIWSVKLFFIYLFIYSFIYTILIEVDTVSLVCICAF